MSKREWLEQKVMCDEWGRPPSLADVPLTIMTRKEAFIKRGVDEKLINECSSEVIKFVNENAGYTFNPNPSDKYLSATGTIKKLEPYEITVIINNKINNCR